MLQAIFGVAFALALGLASASGTPIIIKGDMGGATTAGGTPIIIKGNGGGVTTSGGGTPIIIK